jgi:hypothetical protein
MIDPSYIRNIRDGLKSEHIEANNLDALPEGLVGVYDKELFPPTLKWKKRKETLQFFLVFALAQKEISADFASTILGDEWCKVLANENEITEEKRLKKVNEFIQLHSKRFTSAGEGKFRLYHERFRVYILQKVSEGDLTQFNQLFISLCESELKNNTEKDIPEKERYALEFLSTHYFISAMQGEKVCLNKKDAASLKNIAYDQLYWERQEKASKGFEWSKKMLDQMLSWASKFKKDKVLIECALKKIYLYNQEQNDANRIVQLVTDGDIETALERIQKFESNDKEGLERKFNIYMLCLMELTLRVKDKKLINITAIEKILNDLKKQSLFYNSELFNWTIFFPDIIILKMYSIWKKNKINAEFIFDMTNEIDNEWFCSQFPLFEYKLIQKIFKIKNLNKLRNPKTNNTIELISNIFLNNNFSNNSDKYINEYLFKNQLAKSYKFLEKKYLKFEIVSELSKINNWYYLFLIINKLISKDLTCKNVYIENVFLKMFNSLSNHKRILNLNLCSYLFSNYSWNDFFQKLNSINLDDSDTTDFKNLTNNNLKKKLIKYVIIHKWLSNDPNLNTFIYESMKHLFKNEKLNLKSQILPYSSYNFLNSLLLRKKEFDSAFKLDSKELAYNFGKVFTQNNKIENLKSVLEKKELLEYKVYIIKGVAEGFDILKNKNIYLYINLTKDFPKEFSIIIEKIRKKKNFTSVL